MTDRRDEETTEPLLASMPKLEDNLGFYELGLRFSGEGPCRRQKKLGVSACLKRVRTC
jgi:hypothetical protein